MIAPIRSIARLMPMRRTLKLLLNGEEQSTGVVGGQSWIVRRGGAEAVSSKVDDRIED